MRRLTEFFIRWKKIVFPARQRKLPHGKGLAYHGSDYGGWMLYPDRLTTESIVYSFGIGEDASFDRSIIETYGVQVFAFDPTPRSITWVKAQTWPPEWHFYPLGIAAEDGPITFYPPENPDHVSYSVLNHSSRTAESIQVEMLRLDSITRMLRHERIDVLKLDIEGAEYQVIEAIAGTDTASFEIGQILVEFHHFLPGISRQQTRSAVARLNECGYRTQYVSPNGHEYCFVKR